MTFGIVCATVRSAAVTAAHVMSEMLAMCSNVGEALGPKKKLEGTGLRVCSTKIYLRDGGAATVPATRCR